MGLGLEGPGPGGEAFLGWALHKSTRTQVTQVSQHNTAYLMISYYNTRLEYHSIS